MLRASEISRCRAESRFIGIDFAEASHCSFLFNPLKRSLDFVGDEKKTIFLSATCHAEQAEASLYLKPFYSYCFFWNRSFQFFLLRCNVFPVLFGKSTACIAIHVGIIMLLQILRPYGAGSIVRCTWNYCHVERKRNISMCRLEILRYAQDDKWSYSCKLLVVRGIRPHPSPFPWEGMERRKQAEA